MRIGFIGAGLMGQGMATNLLRAGHAVTVIAHRNRTPIEDLVRQGATEAASPEELAANTDVIFLCLSNSTVVAEIIESLEPSLRRGQIVIDTGTSAPAATRQIAHTLARLGVDYADAPVTGGPEQAAAAALGALCGASPAVFAAIQPLLSCFASTIRHMGPVGSGHAAKLISNYLVIGMISLVAEAFRTAGKAEIDWRDLYDVMLNGSGNSGVLRKMVEPALVGDMDGYRFSISNALKDISYFKDFAGELGAENQLAHIVESFFADAVAMGRGASNVSHLLKS